MKTVSFLFTLLLFLSIGACQTRFKYTNISYVPGQNKYVASGYLSNDPVPMLLNDTIWFGVNMPKPDDAYLLLTGPGFDSLFSEQNGNNYFGANVTVTGQAGIVKKGWSRLFSPGKQKLIVQDIQTNSDGTDDEGAVFIDHCAQYPSLCTFGPTRPNRYALLYSGGKNADNACKRYWNDLELMYLTLRSKCGFDANKIIVVYKDGSKEVPGSIMPVDYAATRISLGNAVADLNSRMNATALDTLFVFTTNHGGGYATASASSSGVTTNAGANHDGAEDNASNGTIDEPETLNKTDEVIFYYSSGLNTASVKDDFWKTRWDALIGAQSPFMVNFFEQCFSGGFLSDMKPASPTKRVNIAAASEFGFSYGMPPDYLYDTYSYFFTLALYGRNLDGTALSPNPDIAPTDGKISIWEAFWYARQKDIGVGHDDFLDDNGDGSGLIPDSTNNPSSGNDGFISKSVIWRW